MSRLAEFIQMFNTVMSFGGKEQRQQQVDDRDRIKDQQYTINKWTEQWNKAQTKSEKENIARIMKSYYGALSPENRAAVDPYLSMGPLDPTTQKREQYRNVVPPPKITADFATNPFAYAEQLFAHEDWKANEKEFMLGIKDPQRNLIGLPGGLFSQRNADGSIDILNEETLELKQFAKENKTTVGTLLANGLKHYGEDTKDILVNGKVFRIQPYIDLRTKKRGVEQQFVRTVQAGKLNKQLQDFLGAFASDNEDNTTYKVYKDFIDIGGQEGIDRATEYLKEMFPDRTFIYREKPREGYFTRAFRMGFFDAISPDINETHYLIAIPGQPIILGNENFYFDDTTNSLYSSDGVRVPDPINFMRSKGVNPDEFFSTTR